MADLADAVVVVCSAVVLACWGARSLQRRRRDRRSRKGLDCVCRGYCPKTLACPLVGRPIQLSRGSVVMSRASLAALSPDMIERITRHTDIITAEDALAELDREEDI